MAVAIQIAVLALIFGLATFALLRLLTSKKQHAPAAKRREPDVQVQVRKKRRRSVSSAAILLSDAHRLPRFVEEGDDLDITVISTSPVQPERENIVELTEFEEVRRSRVDLIYEDEAEIDEPTAPAARILMSAQGDTNCGRFRARNEDSLLMLREHSVFVVADGMGGHHGGGVASELAVKTLNDVYSRNAFQGLVESSRPIPRRAHDLALAIQSANQAVYSRAASTPELSEMGTTLVAARFSPRKQRVYIGHIGDSRCYRVRQGKMRQLTKDHTMASIGVSGPNAQRLVRAVGIGSSVTIDLIVDKPRPNDIYLLCSDGLPKMLGDEDMLAVLRAQPNLDHAVKSLIGLANERGGKDNITVILVRVVERAEGQQLNAASG
ncbi:MAG: protein phosphatase 2C domain-containing protein [Myxococcales bacterium]|jgi:protein phosphatase